VVLERGGVTTEVEKEKDKDVWKFKKPEGLAGKDVNRDAIEIIINSLRRLRAVKLVTENSTPEAEQQYGLKSPANKVTLVLPKDDKTEEKVYLFGNETDDGVYAKQADKPLIFTVGKHVLTALKAELRDPVVYKFDHTKVTGMKLVGWKKLAGSPFTLDL